ncbi:MAG TPA: protein kinase [Myxococcaceae bacterium]|nr:protein kinase [Myxococcaceae bacterium]
MSFRSLVEIAPDTEVRGFRIESRLGAGGYGTVYRARRGERLYALKFLRLREAGHWARREVDVLMRLGHRNLVRFEGCGYWPDESHEFFVVIMDYVHGQRLDEWAASHNPDARQVTLKLIEVARALGAAHQQGVVHRDMKEANILVRASDEEAVVVDFGVAGARDTLRATPGLLPPTTPPYRSPEAWHFFRHFQPGEVYQAGPADDLYALGVVLYWLLTNRLPFTEIPNEMVDEVLNRVPKPPHQINPRVPAALSAVCMKLLEKRPEDRYPDAAAVEAAGHALLATADADWSVPLCTPHATDNATTEWAGRPEEAREGLDAWLRQGHHDEEQPRRGAHPPLVPPRETPAPAVLESAPATPGRSPSVPESPSPVLLTEPAALVAALATPPPREASSPAAASRRLAPWLAVGVLLMVGLGAGVNYLALSARGTAYPAAATSAEPEPLSGSETLAMPLATGSPSGVKVAPPWQAPEGGAGEFFALAAAAPAAPPAARDNGEPSVKSPEKKRRAVRSLKNAVGTGALCMSAA